MATKKPTRDTRDAYDFFLWAADLGVEARVGTMYRDAARLDLPASFAYDARAGIDVPEARLDQLGERYRTLRQTLRPCWRKPPNVRFRDDATGKKRRCCASCSHAF